jgi:hypothetical protein
MILTTDRAVVNNQLRNTAMNKSHLKAYSTAINEAALSRTKALEIELAVGFAVIIECDNAKRLARETLLTIYAQAGSKCSKPGDLDWKAINRRISAAVALFDFIGMEDLNTWKGELTKPSDVVEAFRPHISALKLKSVNEVLLACDKIRAPRKPSEPHGTKLSTKHLHITVPKNATSDELLAMASQLMAMANSMTPTTVEVQETAEA